MSAQYRGQVTVTGITQSATSQAFSGLFSKSNDLMFTNGVFGVSVTSFTTVNVPSWAFEVYAPIGGANYLIAGVSGIGSTTSAILPITNAQGTTQHRFIGIPRPGYVDVIGSSTGVGSTFSAVVTAHLWNPQ